MEMKRNCLLQLVRVLASLATFGNGAGAQSWTQTPAAQDPYWHSIASSADGARLVATTYRDGSLGPGQIFVSTDAGATSQDVAATVSVESLAPALPPRVVGTAR